MNALIWKKIKEIRRNKIKLLAVLLVPVIVLIWMQILNINFSYIVSYFPLMIILLYSVILFSIEDFAFAETVLCTDVKIKDIWSTNIIFLIFTGYIYSNILIIFDILLGKSINFIYPQSLYTINFSNIVQNVTCLLISLGLLAFSTFYISSYSFFRQIISSVGSVVNIALFMTPIMYPKALLFYNKFFYVMIILSLILFAVSYIVVTFSSRPEELIVNLQNLSKTYRDSQTIDE